jgi:hypothetical protein
LWAFHGPVIVVFVVNLVVLVIISVVVARASKKKNPERWTFCSLLQSSFILVPTLGLTWILGLFVFDTNVYSTVIEWFFFICTTLQGIVLFVIHCVINTEVRAAFLRKIGCRKAASKQKSLFELKPRKALTSIATSTVRRFSLSAGRRGSTEPIILPSPNDKEGDAYVINKLCKLEEESVEIDAQMFDKSSSTYNNNNEMLPLTIEEGDDDIVQAIPLLIQEDSEKGLPECELNSDDKSIENEHKRQDNQHNESPLHEVDNKRMSYIIVEQLETIENTIAHLNDEINQIDISDNEDTLTDTDKATTGQLMVEDREETEIKTVTCEATQDTNPTMNNPSIENTIASFKRQVYQVYNIISDDADETVTGARPPSRGSPSIDNVISNFTKEVNEVYTLKEDNSNETRTFDGPPNALKPLNDDLLIDIINDSNSEISESTRVSVVDSETSLIS